MISWAFVAAAAPSGGSLPSALHPTGEAGRTAVSAGLWAVLVVVGAALVLPGARALTVVRIAVPAAAVVQVWALASEAGNDNPDAAAVLAAVAALAGAAVVLLPAYGEAQVDASSYGDEQRFLLSPPGPVLIALIVPLWAMSVVGATAGPLLLAHSAWVPGALASAVGLPAAALAAHTLFRLACRWLVFVPNGVVLHDHLAISEPLPLSRRDIASLGPAPADTSAADLTAQAFGMALELHIAKPATARVVTGRKRGEERSLTKILFSPTRPASVLAAADHRSIKIA